MVYRKIFVIFVICFFGFLYANPVAEKLKQSGYIEIYDRNHSVETFNLLYDSFDQLIDFLEQNPTWNQKLYIAKERFIRSKDRDYYSTDIFGFYNESGKGKIGQISFYYSSCFHEFVCCYYPEFKQAPEIMNFFQLCLEIEKAYGHLFIDTANELGLSTIFSSRYKASPPILLKVVKYLPSYSIVRPHYDGSVFSLFLNSTDDTSLFLSPYKSPLKIDDFYSPLRENANSFLVIPGAFLSEFSIYPTPHIVAQSGKIRYATIAFAMRSDYTFPKVEFSSLPNFKH